MRPGNNPESPLRIFLEYPKMMYRWDDTSIPPGHPSRNVIVNSPDEEEYFRQQGYRAQIYKQDDAKTQALYHYPNKLATKELKQLRWGKPLTANCPCCDKHECGVHPAPDSRKAL